jgi:hypothetical protein
MASTALTLEGGIGPGTAKMKTLLDKHERTDCVRLKTSAAERDGVSPTRENSFDSNSRT